MIENDLLLNEDIKLSSKLKNIKSNNEKIQNYIFEHLEIGDSINYEIPHSDMQKKRNLLDRINQQKAEEKKSRLDFLNQQLELNKSKIENIKKESNLFKNITMKGLSFFSNKLKNLHLDEKNKNLHLDAKNELPSKPELDYKEYPGVLSFGNDKAGDFEDSSLKCQNKTFKDAKELCQKTDDCNSFFAYEGKSDKSGKVCFKNNAGAYKKPTEYKDPKHPNAGYYFKNEYPGVLEFGNDKAGDFEDSSLGCQNKTFKDAKELCQTTDDCNSFFAYEGKSDNPGRICFKNNAKRDKPQTKYNDAEHPNAGYYFV